MSVHVSELTSGEEAAWRTYVDEHSEATLFHSLLWRDVLRNTFKHECRYAMAQRDGAVVGVVPMVAIRSVFFGRSAISVPFGVYGGILADDEEATRVLVEHGRGLAREVGASYVEFRHLTPPPGLALPSNDLYATFACELPDDPSEVLGMIPRKSRAEVRKARKRGDIKTDVGPLDLGEFHRLFALNKRKLGSPVFPRSLFWHLADLFGDDCNVLTVRHDGHPVAAVMNFVWRNTLMSYYSGALDHANRLSANNLMYVAAMEHAAERGLKRFDFGRSRKGTGAFAFKKNMGFVPRDLHYSYILAEGEALPEINASNPKYRLAQSLFKHLPKFAAEKLGSFVAKRMPV